MLTRLREIIPKRGLQEANETLREKAEPEQGGEEKAERQAHMILKIGQAGPMFFKRTKKSSSIGPEHEDRGDRDAQHSDPGRKSDNWDAAAARAVPKR